MIYAVCALVPLLLSCSLTHGLWRTSADDSVVRIEGLTPENWGDVLDPSWVPRVQIPRHARGVRTLQEAMQVVQKGVRDIGRQMGVPHTPHDFRETFGDGSREAFRAAAERDFGEARRQVAGIDGLVDYVLAGLGTTSTPDPEEAFSAYSMVAERLGARSLADQFAPLLRSTTPPNPTVMFNMIGNALASLNMPQEAVSFYRELAGMHAGSAAVGVQHYHQLQNRTLGLLRNRTAPLRQRAQGGLPDYYKSTFNEAMILYRLPCAPGSPACFTLTNEIYFTRRGPGYRRGRWGGGDPGSVSVALAVSTRTPWSWISTPFYIHPTPHQVGQEYDINFNHRKDPMAGAYKPKVHIDMMSKLKESSDCIGTGTGAPDSPRVDTCPFAALAMTGGSPKVFSILEVEPARAVMADCLVSFYDLFRFGGPVGGPYEGQMMPDWAWAGFYRTMG